MKSLSSMLIVTPIFPPDIGGPARYVAQLVHSLQGKVLVRVVTFGHKNDSHNSVQHIALNQAAWQRQWQLFRRVYMAHEKLVYVQGTITVGFLAAIACWFKKKPYLIKFVGDEAWENYQTAGGTLNLEKFLAKAFRFQLGFLAYGYAMITWIVLKQAAGVIVPSKYLQSVLERYYQIPAVCLPNAVEIFSKTNQPLKKVPYSIVYVGRLTPWKNIDQVITALAVLKKQSVHPWQLTVVGSGIELERLRSHSQTQHVSAQVHFIGNQKKADVFQILKKSEFCVLYSSYEGLSHTLLEAMVAQCKIIVSDILANRDVLIEGKLGTLVKPNDPLSLAQAFLAKYDNRKIAAAYQHVVTTYTWQSHVDQLLEYMNHWIKV